MGFGVTSTYLYSPRNHVYEFTAASERSMRLGMRNLQSKTNITKHKPTMIYLSDQDDAQGYFLTEEYPSYARQNAEWKDDQRPRRRVIRDHSNGPGIDWAIAHIRT